MSRFLRLWFAGWPRAGFATLRRAWAEGGLKAWLARVVFLPPLLLVYLSITALGMRDLVEPLATPLHKTGWWPLTHLKAFEETRKLDLAHVLSLTLLGLVWVSWEMITAFYANGAAMTNARRLVWATGAVLLVCDIVLFFTGVSQSSFFGGSSLFAAALLSAMYAAMLVLAATVVNILHGRIR